MHILLVTIVHVMHTPLVARGDATMSTSTVLHAGDSPKFDASFVTTGRRFVRIRDEDGNEVGAFLTDKQARELADTILMALYPTVAKVLAEAGQ